MNTEKKADLNGLNPIPFNQRSVSPLSYSMIFWSSTIIVQIMVIGLYLLPPAGRLNPMQVIAVGLISGTMVSIFMALQGDAGMRYGIPFIIQGRSGFGIKGTRIVAIIRSVPAIAWNGIGSWIGAMAITTVTTQVFGFGNVWFSFFLLLILQTLLSYTGLASIKWFNSTMSIVIFAMLLYFFYVVFSTGKVNFAQFADFKGSWSLPFIAGIMGAAANYTTVMLNASDMIRHIKIGDNKESLLKRSLLANVFGVLPPWMFMVLSGMFIGLASGAKDPIEGLVQLAPSAGFGIILLLFIVLAQVTSNLTLNILPVALVFQDVLKLSWKKGVVAVAGLSVLTMPWMLFTSDYFFKFQNVYSCFLGPALGVMIADYYFIRKKKLNLEMLYDDKGVYNYAGGYSPAGMVSLVVGAIVSFIFLDYSWLVGFPFTMILYTVIKRMGMEKKYEIQESEMKNFNS